MSSDTELSLMDSFAVLKLPSSASSSEIRKAYRNLSLLYHPDKAKDVSAETASNRFDKLHKAYELLSDPIVREKLAKQAAEHEKRTERMGKFESERKKMSEALEKREQEEGRRKKAAKEASCQRELNLERLKEEGRKMREAKSEAKNKLLEVEAEKIRLARQETEAAATRLTAVGKASQNLLEPPLGPLDTTIRLLYPTALHARLSVFLERVLTTYFGPLVNVRFTLPPGIDEQAIKGHKRKRQTEVTCLATFEDMSSAIRLVETASSFKLAEAVIPPPGSQVEDLDQIWVEWAAAKDAARKRREAKKEGRKADEPTEVEGTPQYKLGEPAKLAWWRLYAPQEFAKVLGAAPCVPNNQKTEALSPSVATATTEGPPDFEADVLRRAMEAATAKRREIAEEETVSL